MGFCLSVRLGSLPSYTGIAGGEVRWVQIPVRDREKRCASLLEDRSLLAISVVELEGIPNAAWEETVKDLNLHAP